MVFDITRLKDIRKHLGLTQGVLAQKIGISQSMVAKIEAGTLDPTYSYVKKIESALESLTKDHEVQAGELMTKKLIFVAKKTTVKEIIFLLSKNDISQVPVFEKNIPIGLVSEAAILVAESSGKKTAEEIMLETPPVIDKTARISVVKSLLQFYSLILIKDQNEIIGVITKSDLIRQLMTRGQY